MINFLEQAERLIRINSVSQGVNEEISLHLHGLMRSMGLKTALQEVSHSLDGISKRQFNTIGILGDSLVDRKSRKGLLLTTHVDTVSPGIRSHWNETGGDPFHATIKGDRFYGLGSADAKLDFLCKLKAVERYRERKLKMPVYLAATAGAEYGMLGARFLIKSLVLNPAHVIVGDPSGLAVIHSHKADAAYQISIGYSQLERDAKGYNTRIELCCMGRASHGGHPTLGDSAIARMLAVVQKITEANFHIRLTRVVGGDSIAKVPDVAMAEFYISSSAFDDFRKFFQTHFTGDDVRIEYGGLGESGMRFMPENMLEAIEQVYSSLSALKIETLSPADETFDPPISTMNFSRAQSRPGAVDLVFDFRLLPSIPPAVLEDKLKGAMYQLGSRYPNLTIKATRLQLNPALNVAEDHPLVRAACETQRAAKIDARCEKQALSSEAAQYVAAGFEAIAFGPGTSKGNSHSPNEYNLVEHLDKAVHFYDRLIERFCI